MAFLVKVRVLDGRKVDLHVNSSVGNYDVVECIGKLFKIVLLLAFVNLLFVVALVTKPFLDFFFLVFLFFGFVFKIGRGGALLLLLASWSCCFLLLLLRRGRLLRCRAIIFEESINQ